MLLRVARQLSPSCDHPRMVSYSQVALAVRPSAAVTWARPVVCVPQRLSSNSAGWWLESIASKVFRDIGHTTAALLQRFCENARRGRGREDTPQALCAKIASAAINAACQPLGQQAQTCASQPATPVIACALDACWRTRIGDRGVSYLDQRPEVGVGEHRPCRAELRVGPSTTESSVGQRSRAQTVH